MQAGPYTPTIVTTPAVPATEDSTAVPEQTTVETVMNMTPKNKANFESEKEAIHLILTGIGDEILERITKKRTKNKAKTTKPDSEWKSCEGQSQSKAKDQEQSQSQSQLNKLTVKTGAVIEEYYWLQSQPI
ncbi:hypothetical protein Tco_0772694 [Tanacetum coccineum]|uniref:Uncharacterized protein n=1 Tax=Tanacetum coccineum TaxID=301880 RepID=A0ABQ4ZIL0_9ASTR